MTDLFDPARWKPGPLLPRRDARDGALVFVVAVLCFLACLTAIGAMAADRGARGWTSQLSDSATVVVRARGAESPDAAAARAAETLAGVPGVAEARALEKEKAEALLEPWLGREALLDDLPIPRLVTVELDPKKPAKAAALDSALKAAGVDATVDDHSRWIGDIERSAGIARWAALGVGLLIAAAAAAVIGFATRAGLAAHRDVIEVLHLSGAESGFVARLFQARFARTAALAGLFGAAGAAIIAALARLAGGGDGLTPVLPVAWTDLAVVLPAPIIAALTAAVSARLAAMGMLKELG
ncbi:cell division transport system permease protein [Caulobacter ginsengisoli]|uniref:Cell division transport system permease protein n=1 Tax=Caulobacter ginsengisoli TaxID=400775 RepID=A0ABU0IXV8_9CAUL|nr:ABC transporter permease [Caulobacter ginsengisoli]MDQ0465884.1 cell division transport system permease protein [Caulobacter ginsengisoli]